MPNVGQRSKNVKISGGKKSKTSSKKNDTSKKVRINFEEVEVEEDVTSIVEETAPPPAIIPFTDGLVSAQLQNAVVVTRSGGVEADLLRSMFMYCSEGYPFVGNISAKLSFMKKKGGRLL